MPTVDAHGRPEYPAIVDTQPIIDAKTAALTARLRLMEKQEADALAAYPPAPEPKAAKTK